MSSLPLDTIDIEIQPELAEKVMKKKLATEYLCWTISKKLDSLIGNSGGKINKKKLIIKLMEITNRSRFSVARYIEKGNNIFWRMDKKREVLYLNSFSKICSILEVNNIYSQNIIYDLSLINDCFRDCKGFLVAAIASKTGKPVSVANLSGRCGVCERTVRNNLKKCEELKIIHKVRNFEIISSFNDMAEAKIYREEFVSTNKINNSKLRFKKYKNKCWLLQQVPNSIINQTGRSSISSIRKTVRNNTGLINIEKHQKIYIQKDTGDKGLEYLGTFSDRGGMLHEIGEGNINIFIRR